MEIMTSKGPMDESLLEKRQGPGWVEYWLNGELVHRSVQVELTGVVGTAEAGKFL